MCLWSNSGVPVVSSERYQTSIISQDDGLLHNNVFSITQDEEGFLWFGTADGLNRYDGYDNLAFQNKIDDSTSLSGSFVRALLTDSENNLWVGTVSGGLNMLNKQTNVFTSFNESGHKSALSNNACLSLLEDRNGNVWVGTENGINRIASKTFKVTSFLVDESEVVDYHANGVLDLFVDSDERLWVCTRGGVYYINDFYTKQLNNNITEIDKNLVSEHEARSVYQDANGIVWLASVEGVLTYNPANKILKKRLELDQSYSIVEDTDSTLWVTCGADLYKVNINDYSFFRHTDFSQLNQSGNIIRHLYKDHSNVLWVSLRGVGLVKINVLKPFDFYGHSVEDKNSLGAKTVRAITQDAEGNIWVSTSGFGVNVIDGESRTITRLGYPEDFPYDHALALHGDEYGNVWAGVRSIESIGLIKYNIYTKQVTHFDHSAIKNTGITNNLVRAIFEDSNGMYWLGKDNGVEVFNPVSEEFVAYYMYKQTGEGMAAPSVQSGAIVEDAEGNFWIGSWGGLTKITLKEDMNYDNPDFERYYHESDSNSLIDNRVISLQLSSDNKLWIGTYGGGLSCFDIAQKQFTNYTIEDGLASNVVYGILEDKMGDLWLSTNYGLSKFETHAREFKKYYKFDGIQHNQFYWGAFFKDDESKLYFGGINGLTAFNPESIGYDTVYPKVVFTEFSVFNREVNVGEEVNGNVILEADINYANSITLTHKEKIFSIGFSVLHYVNPEGNLFSYKLEGFSEDWIEIESGRRFVTYTNLPPGEYVFHVRGANYNGVWSANERQLKIIVLPPFWRNWWFIVSVMLFVALVFIALYRLRIRNLRLQKKELKKLVGLRTQELEAKNLELETHHERLERLVDERTKDLMIAKNQAEESDRLKTAFLANMSHEIRTPLNAIVGFSSLLTGVDANDEKKKEFADAINASTDDLLHLVDDIIDLSRIESNDLVVVKNDCDISQLLYGLSPIVESLLHRFGKTEAVSYKVKAPDKKELIVTDQIRVRQVLINLLANAIKFTDSGIIEYGCDVKASPRMPGTDEVIEFYVKDSGIGISPELQKSIFGRFTKSHETSDNLYRGAGLGLPISKSLINLLGGNLWVESKVGEGATFFFTLPYIQPSRDVKSNTVMDKVEQDSFESINWAGRCILVAEDEDSNYDYLRELLSSTDVTLVRAINGEEVVKKFLREKFDLVLMDIRMPKMDGYEATRKIKQVDPDIPIIALTAFGMFDDESKCRMAGCDDYIAKPFAPRDLALLKKYMYAPSG